jgi:hypothetical protein
MEGQRIIMNNREKVLGTKEIATTGILLAICIISQFFKNLSIFITGPIINTCIVLAVLWVGLACGLILCALTPITSYIIAASPIMSAVPLLIPFIMLGNCVLALTVNFLLKKDFMKSQKGFINIKNMIFGVICSLAKGAFMGLTISLWLLPTFIPAESPLRNKLPVFQTTFSLYQFITALIGFVYVFLICAALRGRVMESSRA